MASSRLGAIGSRNESCAPRRVRVPGRDDRRVRDERVDEPLQVAGQPDRPLAQGRQADLVEDGQRRVQRRQRQDARVGQAPAVGVALGPERLGHLEPGGVLVAPPAAQPGHARIAGQSLGDEHLAGRARAAVEVLVGAPRRDVDVGAAQVDGHVADRVGEVPQGDPAGGVDGPGQPGDVVDLAGRVVRPGQDGHGQPVPGGVDGRLERLRFDEVLARRGTDDDEVAGRVRAMQPQVALDGVAIGREGRRVDEDRPAVPGRPVDRGEEQVQADGQGVDRRDLVGLGADEPGARPAQAVIELEPAVGVEVAVDAEARPGVELVLDGRPGGPWLGAQRLPGQVRLGPAVGAGRQQEPLAQGGQRVGRIERPGVGLAGVDAARRRSSQAQVRQDLLAEDLDELDLVAPDVVQVDLVVAHVDVVLDVLACGSPGRG